MMDEENKSTLRFGVRLLIAAGLVTMVLILVTKGC